MDNRYWDLDGLDLYENIIDIGSMWIQIQKWIIPPLKSLL